MGSDTKIFLFLKGNVSNVIKIEMLATNEARPTQKKRCHCQRQL